VESPSEGARYDAAVVGGGIGGLVCAAYLAVAGRRVLLAEQHDVTGGNSQVFRRRRKYEFDVGVHYLGDCGPDGIIPAILAGLGARDRVLFRLMDQDGFDRITLPGLAMDVPVGWDRYLVRLQAALPAEAAGLARCVNALRQVAGQVRQHLVGGPAVVPGQRGGPDPGSESVSGYGADAVRQGSQTLGRLFAECGLSARAATLLAAQSGNYGTPPSTTMASTHAAMLDHYLRGAYYPVGGGQVLAATLVEVIEAHGGTVRTRCLVEGIAVSDDGRVEGLRLAGGEFVPAPVVVSNADYQDTVLSLCGGRGFRPAVLAKTEAATARAATAVVYLALDRPLDLPNANLWCWQDDDIEHAYAGLADGSGPGRPPFAFLSFASLKDPGNRLTCPPGHANFQVMTLVPARCRPGPGPGGYRRDPDYLAGKARLTEALLDAAERAVGPFRDRVTHLEAATGLTNRRYTLSGTGTPFGMAEWGAPGRRPDVRTGVAGLYITGKDTRYGAGISGAAISGIAAAAQILQRPLLPQVHAGAVLGDGTLLPERGEDFDPLRVSRGRARRDARGLARIG